MGPLYGCCTLYIEQLAVEFLNSGLFFKHLSTEMQTYKEALNVVPSDPPCKDDNAQNHNDSLKKDINSTKRKKLYFLLEFIYKRQCLHIKDQIKVFKGTVVNEALPSLYGEYLELKSPVNKKCFF